MSDRPTPETDAAAWVTATGEPVVFQSHARQLERELNAAKADIEAMREVINEIYASFADEPQSDSSWLLDDRQVTALSKIKPFIK